MQTILNNMLLALLLGITSLEINAEEAKKSKLDEFHPFEGSSSTRIYNIGGAETPFFYYKKNELIISANCLKQNVNLDCEAAKALLKLLPDSYSNIDLSGGREFGALACLEVFSGNTIVGKTANGAEVGFCLFKDGSMTSFGSISSAAELKRKTLLGPKTDPSANLIENKK
ncbi:MAG: hypothetical protein HYV97_07955 [Bdellovibrio sp.]|nr:hypothetical protein [Bdellovibrio sp.]